MNFLKFISKVNNFLSKIQKNFKTQSTFTEIYFIKALLQLGGFKLVLKF
jgi:hypothetical protein